MKKKYIYAIAIILLVAVLSHINYVHKYNTCADELGKNYSAVYKTLQSLCEGETVSFEQLNVTYAYFYTTYVEWQRLYWKTYEINLIPDLHVEAWFSPDEVADAFRKFRAIYYDCIEDVYFDKGEVSEQLKEDLEEVNDDMCLLSAKLSYIP